MSEVTQVPDGYLQIQTTEYRPPFFFDYPQILDKLISGYGNDPVWSLKRRLILLFYFQEGKTAEETSFVLAKMGYELSATGVRQLAFRLANRAEKLCQKYGLPIPEESDGLPHFDRSQWEHRFHPDAKRQDDDEPTRKHVPRARVPSVSVDPKVVSDLDRILDGDEEMGNSLAAYGQLTGEVLLKLGAVSDTALANERATYVPFLRSEQWLLSSLVPVRRLIERSVTFRATARIGFRETLIRGGVCIENP
jgi:hypothetical protein